jgi:hypothetical protein
MFALLLALPLLTARPAAACSAPDDPEKIDVQELVRQAVINFNARESLPRNYGLGITILPLPKRACIRGGMATIFASCCRVSFSRHGILLLTFEDMARFEGH